MAIPSKARVVVIGGGIAGYSAAIAARRDGAEVTVLARAPGATALYAGGMEIVDDIDAILGTPHHPLARLGMDSVGLATELDRAMSTLMLALGKDGLRFEGGWRSRGLYADIHGLARPANVVPETVARLTQRAKVGSVRRPTVGRWHDGRGNEPLGGSAEGARKTAAHGH